MYACVFVLKLLFVSFSGRTYLQVGQERCSQQICETGLFNKIEMYKFVSPVSTASREVANVTERQKPNTQLYGVKELVFLSVCQNWTL